jgi:hypothetical protein
MTRTELPSAPPGPSLTLAKGLGFEPQELIVSCELDEAQSPSTILAAHVEAVRGPSRSSFRIMKPMGMYADDGMRVITPFSQQRDLYRKAFFEFVFEGRPVRTSGIPNYAERSIGFVHGACRLGCAFSN